MDLLRALDRWLTAAEAPPAPAAGWDPRVLHYSRDLDPAGCARQTWYRLRGTAADPRAPAERLMLEAGRRVERMVLEALVRDGQVAEAGTQVTIRPARPSAARWRGRADAVTVDGVLLEVKTARAAAFERARSGDVVNGLALAKSSHVWQVSAYFHELAAAGRASEARLVYLDRDGSHAPVEVPVAAGELLQPLEAVVERENAGNLVASVLAEPGPARLLPKFEIRFWKGRALASGERRGRAPEGALRLPWNCRYCPYRWTCGPGPDEWPIDVPAETLRAARAEAESRWARGATGTPLVVEVDPWEL